MTTREQFRAAYRAMRFLPDATMATEAFSAINNAPQEVWTAATRAWIGRNQGWIGGAIAHAKHAPDYDTCLKLWHTAARRRRLNPDYLRTCSPKLP